MVRPEANASEVDLPATPAVVWSDADLLVVEKPAGLLAVPGRGPERADCLSARVQAAWAGVLVVHRLDMATSGLMLFARSAEVQRQLSRAFELRDVDKRYEAVVAGDLGGRDEHDADSGTIALPIAADWPRRPLRIVDAAGKPSITRWQRLRAEPVAGGLPVVCAATRVSLWPLTGRTHQLRVHLQAIGHPILGDLLYGDTVAQTGAPRLLLHACSLALQHPRTGERLQFDSPVPF